MYDVKLSGPLLWASVALFCLILQPLNSARGDDKAALPSGFGLSAKYPGDSGIGGDPSVLLAEDFEIEDIGQLGKKWDSISNDGGLVLNLDGEQIPDGSPGKWSLKATAHPGKDTGGHLYSRLKRASDQVYARFYVRFSEDEKAFIHHFVHMGGYHPATAWPQGGAGSRPKGDDRFTVGIEPFPDRADRKAPGNWNFYTYWSEMKVSAGGKYWGNGIAPKAPLVAPRAKWQCVEFMIKTNSTPDRRDGELALWLDGKPVMHVAPGTPRGPWTGMGFKVNEEPREPFEGFRWRSDDRLKVNFFWLLHYVTEGALKRHGASDFPAEVSVWFDHVVVAEEYIGPVKPR